MFLLLRETLHGAQGSHNVMSLCEDTGPQEVKLSSTHTAHSRNCREPLVSIDEIRRRHGDLLQDTDEGGGCYGEDGPDGDGLLGISQVPRAVGSSHDT